VSGRGFVISRAGEDAFFISISVSLLRFPANREFFPRCYPDGLHGGPVFHPFYVPFFVISVNRVRFRTEAKNGKVQPANRNVPVRRYFTCNTLVGRRAPRLVRF